MPQIEDLPAGSSRQRNNLNHQAIEDYLKTIYQLAMEETPVSTSRIAAAREVKPGSVTSMLQRLDKLNLVYYEKHYGVTLTDKGEQIALEVLRHHRLIELYLIEALGFEWDEVHEQADILEHVISEKLEERIAAALNYPTLDPHGDPIPAKDGSIIDVASQSLDSVPAGQRVRIARILDDSDGEMLRYLADIGLMPGVEATVLGEIHPAGPINVTVAGRAHTLGRNYARSILIELL